MEKGKIIQVSGPVIDVLFEKGNLPHIKDALTVDNHGKKCVMEVAKHMGHNIVRCIMLSASEGLCRDMEVTQTGAGITTLHVVSCWLPVKVCRREWKLPLPELVSKCR